MAEQNLTHSPAQTPRDRFTEDDIALIRELAEAGLCLRDISEALKAMHRSFDGTDIH